MALVLLVGLLAGSGPFAVDHAILVGLRRPTDLATPIGPAWLLPAMREVTALGSGPVLGMVVLAAAGLLLALGRRHTAVLLLAASVSGGIALSLLKLHVGRARPALVPHLVDAAGLSFPSGHSTDSAVAYLSLAALATRVVPVRAARGYVVACAIALVGAIGISRVYLGVHWPSDVLAGWGFGTLWALAWWRAGEAWAPSRAGRSA